MICAMGVGVVGVRVISLALAGFEMVLVFPELVIFLHERANLSPVSTLVSRAFSVHGLGLSTRDRRR